MGKKVGGLNVGLESLIGDLGQEVLSGKKSPDKVQPGLQDLPISQLRAGKFQPRRHFNQDTLNELAISIAEHGVIQPLVVRKIKPEQYEIIAGERRFRAAQQAGLSAVPCVIKDYSDQEALAVALIENLQRSDLNAIEVAQSLQKLLNNFQLTHEKVAQLVGRSRSSVTNFVRLLDLTEVVQDALFEKSIEMGHARALLPLNESEQKYLLNIIKSKRLTVRQTEAKVKEMTTEKAASKEDKTDRNIVELENSLSEFLGYAVTVSHGKKGKGKIVLKYNSVDELDGILEKWGYKAN